MTTGTIYFIENGLYSYQRLKDIAESTKEYGKRLLLFLELWAQTFLKRAKIYTKFQDYESSAKWYKYMIQYWWIGNLPKYEVVAYEGLAKAYYYLLDIPRSKSQF